MSETDQINACNQAFMEALKQGNGAKCASFYDENGMLMPPNELPVKGRDAIRQHFSNLGADPTVTFKTLNVEVSGGLAYQHSQVSWSSNGETKYTDSLDVLRQQDDNTWLFLASAWNSAEGFNTT